MYLTEKQSRILQYIKDYRTQHGFSPTLEEIARDRPGRIQAAIVEDQNLRAAGKIDAVLDPGQDIEDRDIPENDLPQQRSAANDFYKGQRQPGDQPIGRKP